MHYALPLTLMGTLAVALTGCGEQPTAPSSPTSQLVTIIGSVRDTALRPLGDAKVEFGNGPTSGHLAATGDDGRFSLSGSTSSSGAFTLKVTKDGYFPVEASFTMRSPSEPRQLDFTLTAVALLDLSGQYTVTFTADTACHQLPAAVRTRTYIAMGAPTTPIRTRFAIRLSGASFFRTDNSFSVNVADDFARFFIYNVDLFDDEPVVEEVGPTTYLALIGSATATARRTDPVVAARFDGMVSYCAADTAPTTSYFRCPVEPVVCESPNHRLILTRR